MHVERDTKHVEESAIKVVATRVLARYIDGLSSHAELKGTSTTRVDEDTMHIV